MLNWLYVILEKDLKSLRDSLDIKIPRVARQLDLFIHFFAASNRKKNRCQPNHGLAPPSTA